jgi:hypothetical protein
MFPILQSHQPLLVSTEIVPHEVVVKFDVPCMEHRRIWQHKYICSITVLGNVLMVLGCIPSHLLSAKHVCKTVSCHYIYVCNCLVSCTMYDIWTSSSSYALYFAGSRTLISVALSFPWAECLLTVKFVSSLLFMFVSVEKG